jgi:hypothetical protein
MPFRLYEDGTARSHGTRQLRIAGVAALAGSSDNRPGTAPECRLFTDFLTRFPVDAGSGTAIAFLCHTTEGSVATKAASQKVRNHPPPKPGTES